MTRSLSVLMPVKNGGTYLKRAVVSTLRAMPHNAELLVMNDGSTDNTATILESISDGRLRVYQRSSSRGVAKALNSLLEESNAPMIARMDADDICFPWRFIVQTRLLSRNGGIVFGNAVYCSPRGWPQRPTLRLPKRSRSFSRDLLDRNPFVHPTMLAEREIVTSVGGYQDVGAEDYDLWLRLACQDVPFSVAVAPVVMYRQHQNQVTTSSHARHELRSKWFSEPLLVKSWAILADKEYGLSFREKLVSNSSTSIDSMKLTPEFAQASSRRI